MCRRASRLLCGCLFEFFVVLFGRLRKTKNETFFHIGNHCCAQNRRLGALGIVPTMSVGFLGSRGFLSCCAFRPQRNQKNKQKQLPDRTGGSGLGLVQKKAHKLSDSEVFRRGSNMCKTCRQTSGTYNLKNVFQPVEIPHTHTFGNISNNWTMYCQRREFSWGCTQVVMG